MVSTFARVDYGPKNVTAQGIRPCDARHWMTELSGDDRVALLTRAHRCERINHRVDVLLHVHGSWEDVVPYSNAGQRRVERDGVRSSRGLNNRGHRRGHCSEGAVTAVRYP